MKDISLSEACRGLWWATQHHFSDITGDRSVRRCIVELDGDPPFLSMKVVYPPYVASDTPVDPEKFHLIRHIEKPLWPRQPRQADCGQERFEASSFRPQTDVFVVDQGAQ